MVERFCDEAVWIDAGENRTTGDTKRVVQMYLTDVERGEDKHLAAEDAKAQLMPVPQAPPAQVVRESVELHVVSVATESPTDDSDSILVEEDAKSDNEPPVNMFTATEGRWGSGGVQIEKVTLEGDHGPAHVFHSGEPMTIRMQISAAQAVDDFAFGISIFGADGVCCYGTNTNIEEMESELLEGTGEVVFAIARLDLVEGTYKLDVAVHKRDGFSYDYHRLLYTFRVKSRIKDIGIYRPLHAWRFTDNVRFKETVDPSDG
jgi:hypothetical protein